MKIIIWASLFQAVVSFSVPKTSVPRSSSALFAEANGSAAPKKILVLGGDGFCGWPTSLYLSDQGHDVVVVDNLSRRNIDLELGCDSLTPIQPMEVSLIELYFFIHLLCFWMKADKCFSI
jgi:UDP-sulfoquinovose synthase